MTRPFRRASLAVAGCTLALSAPAQAQEEQEGCSVTPQGVSFGSYDTLSATPLDGVGNIHVTCGETRSFTVSLSTGSGSYEQRLMSGGADQLGYNLYTDASRTSVWGDGFSASNVSASGTNVNLTVYGRIPAGQNVSANAYGDILTVTVDY